MSKGKKRSGARPGRPQPLRGTKGKRKGARLWYVDRKSGSAGMPRPISYAVFCLKKKKQALGFLETSAQPDHRIDLTANGRSATTKMHADVHQPNTLTTSNML